MFDNRKFLHVCVAFFVAGSVLACSKKSRSGGLGHNPNACPKLEGEYANEQDPSNKIIV